MSDKLTFWGEFLYNAQPASNVRVVTCGGQYKATHSLLLASASELLRSLLVELHQTEQQSVILLPDFSEDEVEQFFQFLLTGDVGDAGSLCAALGLTVNKVTLEDELEIKVEINRTEEDFLPEFASTLDEMFENLGNNQDGSKDNNETIRDTNSPQQLRYRSNAEIDVEMEVLDEDVKGDIESMWKSKNNETIPEICPQQLKGSLHTVVNEVVGDVSTSDVVGDVSTNEVVGDVSTNEGVGDVSMGEILLQVEKDGELFQCKICQKTCKRRKKLKEHIRTIHIIGATLKCKECFKVFYYQRQLKSHENVHLPEDERNVLLKHCCSFCDKKFTRISAAKNHERTHKKLTWCKQCAAAFRTKGDFNLHWRTKHTKEFNASRRKTEEEENSGSNEDDNKDSSEGVQETYSPQQLEEKPFVDTNKEMKEYTIILDDGFDGDLGSEVDENRDIRISINRDTTPEVRMQVEKVGELFRCKICQKTCKRQNALIAHIGTVHKIGAQLKCDECPKVYYYQYEVNNHKIVHIKEKSFICDTCGTGFKTDTYLKNHRNVHVPKDERNVLLKHCCSFCDKRFPFISGAKDHERTHSNKKTISCNQCGKAFRTKGNCQTHNRRKHKKEYKAPPTKTEEEKEVIRNNSVKRRAIVKAMQGGVMRTEEERIRFNEYMRQYNGSPSATKGGLQPPREAFSHQGSP